MTFYKLKIKQTSPNKIFIESKQNINKLDYTAAVKCEINDRDSQARSMDLHLPPTVNRRDRFVNVA